jgi:hypothetical protein
MSERDERPDADQERDEERVRTRAESLAKEEPPPKDPEASARALLKESDERTEAGRAYPQVRRTSEETTPPSGEPRKKRRRRPTRRSFGGVLDDAVRYTAGRSSFSNPHAKS